MAGDEFGDPGLRRLRAPALDAEALARVLGDQAIGGFDVRTMLNEPTAVVSEAVEEFFADRHPDDLLLLHFSGHGVKDDNGELYFATPSTKLNRLAATAVSAEFVNRRMGRSRCRRIVLLLDCCYAGAFARGALPRAGTDVHVEEQFGGRGRVVITASNALEYAFDGTDLADAQETTSPSVFTRALVEGLETGEADRDQDGFVGIHELYDFVYDKVRAVTPSQTPGKWTFDVQGDLIIARRGRPVDRPAPLPTELQEAVDHPIAKIRRGRSASWRACGTAATPGSRSRRGWPWRSWPTTTAGPSRRRRHAPSPTPTPCPRSGRRSCPTSCLRLRPRAWPISCPQPGPRVWPTSCARFGPRVCPMSCARFGPRVCPMSRPMMPATRHPRTSAAPCRRTPSPRPAGTAARRAQVRGCSSRRAGWRCWRACC
ncbi:caspase family protein [Nonomuraea rubra]|uniref:caspase family protein n=1 Tax=Nonomuraea rubra TaxID=46180 RepID=UPI00361A9993